MAYCYAEADRHSLSAPGGEAATQLTQFTFITLVQIVAHLVRRFGLLKAVRGGTIAHAA